VLKLLHDLKARGTPVHALGLQSHIGSWDDSSNANGQQEWRKFLDEVTGMGLDLLITEFDVNDRKLPADIKVRDAGVAAMAKDYLDVTFSYRQCRDFLMWGMADHTSWLQTWQRRRARMGRKPPDPVRRPTARARARRLQSTPRLRALNPHWGPRTGSDPKWYGMRIA
jgi:endo-1,4-beta-xylanase